MTKHRYHLEIYQSYIKVDDITDVMTICRRGNERRQRQMSLLLQLYPLGDCIIPIYYRCRPTSLLLCLSRFFPPYFSPSVHRRWRVVVRLVNITRTRCWWRFAYVQRCLRNNLPFFTCRIVGTAAASVVVLVASGTQRNKVRQQEN